MYICIYIRLLDRSKICRFHIDRFLIDVVWRGGTDPYNYEWNWFWLSWLQRYLCVGTTVRKTTMPGGHTCCPLQHNHGLNLRLRSRTALKVATNKRKGRWVCVVGRMGWLCVTAWDSLLPESAGTRQLVSCAINTPERIQKNWPAHHAGRIEISDSSSWLKRFSTEPCLHW